LLAGSGWIDLSIGDGHPGQNSRYRNPVRNQNHVLKRRIDKKHAALLKYDLVQHDLLVRQVDVPGYDY
jgi:hypothetical protein